MHNDPKTPPKIKEELKQAVTDYLITEAHILLIRPSVEEYTAAAWAESDSLAPIYADPIWSEFISPDTQIGADNIEFASSEDARRFYDVLERHKQAAGYDLPPDHCPLLSLEYKLSQLSRAIVNESHYIHGLEFERLISIGRVKQCADLVIGLVISETGLKVEVEKIKDAANRSATIKATAYAWARSQV